MTSEFLGKKYGGCHSLVAAHPSVICSEWATPLYTSLQLTFLLYQAAGCRQQNPCSVIHCGSGALGSIPGLLVLARQH